MTRQWTETVYHNSQLVATGKSILELLTFFAGHSSRLSKLNSPPSLNKYIQKSRSQLLQSFHWRWIISLLLEVSLVVEAMLEGDQWLVGGWCCCCCSQVSDLTALTVCLHHMFLLVAVAVSVCGAGLVCPGSVELLLRQGRYAHSHRSTGTQTGYWETTITINKTYTPQEK